MAIADQAIHARGERGRTTLAFARVPELDGVRGIAILMVLMVHLSVTPLYDGATEPLLRTVLGIGYGWSGVDLFFVLSGFLITGILIDTRSSRCYFRAFYMRRVLRIFPLYFATLLLAFGVLFPMAHAVGLFPDIGAGESLWYWSYLSNWRSAFGHEVRGLSHTWSLAIEEQFYMVWPLVVLLVPPKRLPSLCAGIVAAVLVVRTALAPVADPMLLYHVTPLRLDSLATGALLAAAVRDARLVALLRKWWRAALAAGALTIAAATAAAGTTAWDHGYMSSFGFTGFALVYGCMVFRTFETAGSGTVLARAMRHPFLMSFGKYSYAIYLLHRPIGIAFSAWLRRLPVHLGPAHNLWLSLASIVVGATLAYAAAWISWRWLETPFLRLKDRFPYALRAS